MPFADACKPGYSTRRTKTNNEILVYYNLGVGMIDKVAVARDNGVCIPQKFDPQECCNDPINDNCQCPSDFWAATVVPKFNRGPGDGSIPKQAPLFFAVEDYENPTVAGDVFWHVCLPPCENDKLICFDQGVVPNPGTIIRAIPRKFNPVNHYVLQRPENTLTLNDLFVSDRVGLQRIRGVPCTIIVKVNPDGAGAFQEIQYYCNVMLNPRPMNSGSDGNASIEISMEGTYSFCAIFSATPPGGDDVVGVLP